MGIKNIINNMYFYRLFDEETNESMILCSRKKYSDEQFINMCNEVQKKYENEDDFERNDIFNISEYLVWEYDDIDFVYDVGSYYFKKE